MLLIGGCKKPDLCMFSPGRWSMLDSDYLYTQTSPASLSLADLFKMEIMAGSDNGYWNV